MKKTTKRREQFILADALYEMGMEFDIIEKISGITPQELLMKQANIIDFQDEESDNMSNKKNKLSYQEPRNKETNNRGSNPDD